MPEQSEKDSPMTEWIWLNGDILPLSDACLSVEDRGFQFADGVYEVIRFYNGKPFTLDLHLERLWKSAVGIQITPPLTTGSLAHHIGNLISKTEIADGMIYLQLTRGVAPRNHLIPEEIAPTLLFYARALAPLATPGKGEGVSLLSVPDERWKRCWVKSIALLPNLLAKNAAVAAGADEAAFIDLGYVTECSTSNLFAVIGDKLVTHPIGTKVLPGITRHMVLEIAGELGIEVDERAIREEEAPRADELFITSTTREINWVSRWNDTYIGQGRCGPTTLKLHHALVERIRQETGVPDLAAAVA
jgi:D-alanine transaminase